MLIVTILHHCSRPSGVVIGGNGQNFRQGCLDQVVKELLDFAT